MHFVYAGYSETLNLESFENFGEIVLLKFGYARFLETPEHEQDWVLRMNEGYRRQVADASSPKGYRLSEEIESEALACCNDWRLLAKVCCGEWSRAAGATSGLEARVKKFITNNGYLIPSMAGRIEEKMKTAYKDRYGSEELGTNGRGDIVVMDAATLARLRSEGEAVFANDPLSDQLISKVAAFVEAQLARDFKVQPQAG